VFKYKFAHTLNTQGVIACNVIRFILILQMNNAEVLIIINNCNAITMSENVRLLYVGTAAVNCVELRVGGSSKWKMSSD